MSELENLADETASRLRGLDFHCEISQDEATEVILEALRQAVGASLSCELEECRDDKTALRNECERLERELAEGRAKHWREAFIQASTCCACTDDLIALHDIAESPADLANLMECADAARARENDDED